MLIGTAVLQHNLGIDSLLLIHHILGKLNFILRLVRRALKSQCGPRPKKFGDPLSSLLKFCHGVRQTGFQGVKLSETQDTNCLECF